MHFLSIYTIHYTVDEIAKIPTSVHSIPAATNVI